MIGSRIPWSCAAAAATLLTASMRAQLPAHAVRLSAGSSSTFYSSAIARDGDRMFVITVDTQSTPTLRYARSIDGGRTWPGLLRPLGQSGDSTSLAVAGDRVIVGWSLSPGRYLMTYSGVNWGAPLTLPVGGAAPVLAANGLDATAICIGGLNALGAYAVHSADGGQSWSAPVDLAVGLPAGPDTNPILVTDSGDLHVFWIRSTPQIHLAHQRSLDGGATWLPAAQVIGNSPLIAAVAGAGRLFVQAGSTLWRSTNRGASWTPVPGHGLASPSGLAMDGANMLAIENVRSGSSWTRRVATSRDAGSTWSSWPAFTDMSGDTLAAVAGTAMFVRTSAGLLQSDDFGSSWRQLGLESSFAFRAQRDAVDVLARGSGEMWVYGIEGHTWLGAGSTGSGSAIPLLTGHGLCGLGRPFELELSHTLGGTFAACLLDLGGVFNIPVGSSTLYVAPSALSLVAVTSGPIGQPGVGSASFPLRVPSAPIFVGARLLSQCFVLDPGVPAGFCASAARESWIR